MLVTAEWPEEVDAPGTVDVTGCAPAGVNKIKTPRSKLRARAGSAVRGVRMKESVGVGRNALGMNQA